jgi:hypothetical protein
MVFKNRDGSGFNTIPDRTATAAALPSCLKARIKGFLAPIARRLGESCRSSLVMDFLQARDSMQLQADAMCTYKTENLFNDS